MEGRKDERGTERERDREVENVNYINISLRRERLTNVYSTADATKVRYTGKQPATSSKLLNTDDGQRQTDYCMFLTFVSTGLHKTPVQYTGHVSTSCKYAGADEINSCEL